MRRRSGPVMSANRRRRPHFEAAGGGAISPLMDARPRAARPATVGAASAQAGDDPQPGEERTATPFSEQGHAAEAQAVEPGGTAVVARAAAKKMGGMPARGLTRTAHHVGRADRKTEWSGASMQPKRTRSRSF